MANLPDEKNKSRNVRIPRDDTHYLTPQDKKKKTYKKIVFHRFDIVYLFCVILLATRMPLTIGQ